MRSSLADYQLLGPFGTGGELDGTWLARPPARIGQTAATVVVTELGDPGPGWPDLSARLAALAAVNNEHLPHLVEAGCTEEDDGTVAWVARLDADARPIPTGGTDRTAALLAVAGAARAAHALHDAGMAHGDIRPAALLVAGERFRLEPPFRTVALRNERAGPSRRPVDLDAVDPTTLWGEGPSRAGDIWSLGATAHALIARRPIHPALADDGIVTAVQRTLIEPPQIATDIEGPLDALIRSCLAPDPADRPATAAELAERLEGLVAAR